MSRLKKYIIRESRNNTINTIAAIPIIFSIITINYSLSFIVYGILLFNTVSVKSKFCHSLM